MKDPKFQAFLQNEIEVAKTAITSGNLTLDEVIAAAQEIKKTEARIDRMNNPRPRKPKEAPVELAEAA